MKKSICVLLVLSMLFLFCACGNKDDIINEAATRNVTTSEQYENILEIKENVFVAQIDDIYRSTEKYKSQYAYVKYEGFVMKQKDSDGTAYTWVCRYGPGCCGSGGTPGFAVIYDGEMPDEKTWVEVTGTLEIASEGDPMYTYLHNLLGTLYTSDNTAVSTYAYVKAVRITRPSKQGLETVYN